MDNVIHVDENDTILGEISRADAHKHGFLHRVVAIYLFNDKGDILIQERMDSGAYDHSAAGHVDPGETYEQAALRELQEELGVRNVELHEVGVTKSKEINKEKNTRKYHIFKIFECVAQPEKLQEKEVKRVFWDNPLRVYHAMQNDPLNKIYTGGFKESLRYLLTKKHLI